MAAKRIQKKYIIGYSNDVIRPLCILPPEMIGYVKCFDSNKTMSFVADDKLRTIRLLPMSF